MYQIITIPEWIACRSYLWNTAESKTIIANNKIHKTILLDGPASDLYHFLCENNATAKDNLLKYAKEHGLSSEIDGFMEQLHTLKMVGYDTDAEDDYVSAPLNYQQDAEEKSNGAIEDRVAKWAFGKGFLWSVFMELTYKCNLRCIHCYNPAFRGEQEISFEKAKEVIDDAVELGCFELTVSGGECTLDSDFIKIIEYARQKRLNVHIFTNGLSLYQKPELLKKIVSLYPYQVGISIYSADKKRHEKVTTVAGSWDKSVAVLEELKKYGVHSQVKTVQLNETVDTWRDTIELAKKYDTAIALDVTLTPTIEGNKKTWEHMVNDEKLMELFSNPESPMYVGGWTEPPEINVNRDGPCYAGSHIVLIRPNLDVTGCVSLPLKFGSVKTQRLKNIWTDGQNNPESELYKWQHITLAAFKDCFKEDYCRFCHFCAGMGMLEDKLYAKSELLCKLAKMKMKVYYELKNKQTDKPYQEGICQMK